MSDKNSGRANNHKRIVMCMGPFCNAGLQAERNAEVLKPLLQEINDSDVPLSITLEFSSCLSMCGAGPNWIVYPEEKTYHHIEDGDEVRRIINELSQQ